MKKLLLAVLVATTLTACGTEESSTDLEALQGEVDEVRAENEAQAAEMARMQCEADYDACIRACDRVAIDCWTTMSYYYDDVPLEQWYDNCLAECELNKRC